jgi:uncharacterized protein with von Willebrand factor type A (vWA) domain
MTPAPAPGGHIAENIAYFARALRKAGLPVGPRAVIEAIEAVEVAGIGGREDFYWTLHAILVKRPDHTILFDQAFRIFWRRRALIEKMMASLMRMAPGKPDPEREKALKRIADALAEAPPPPQARPEPSDRLDLDMRMTVSDRETFRSKDFEQMSQDEIDRARREIADLVLPADALEIRRFGPAPKGRIDPRRTMRASLRAGGAVIALRHRDRRERKPPLVALCDISGSMSQYSRVFLHFLHAISKSGRKVHAFLFATQLTNVTRSLDVTRDPDVALAACGKTVKDWDGGTNIAKALHQFNNRWGRRVLGQGATVLLITDGLERRVFPQLGFEMERLAGSCRKLIWLNPLLRFDGFEARAEGIRAMLPHVDEFRTLHNLESMEALCEALSADSRRVTDPKRWVRAA